MSLLAYQPFKGIYVLGAFTFELAVLPIWLFKYTTGYGRQHPKWTFRQALSVRMFFSGVYYLARIQVCTFLSLKTGAEKERFVCVKPAKYDYYQGPLLLNADVKPEEIGATWYPAPLSEGNEKKDIKVILHIHGGAFVTGDGRTGLLRFFADLLLQHSPATHIFAPQYRLSTLPALKTSNPFPAALQDSLTSYLYLINELKISPNDVILSGDSAGGNLAISLLRYMTDYGQALALPTFSATLLWSPWIDPSDDSDALTSSNPNYNTDYLSYPLTRWGSEAYAGLGNITTLTHSYANHKNVTFRTYVPIFITTGGVEVLCYDNVEWSEKMRQAGNDVTLDVADNAPHDILVVGNLIGFEDEATNCAKRAGLWMTGKRS